MISETPSDNIAKLNKICADAQIGRWEVDFSIGQCLIAEALLKTPKVSGELLSTDELTSTVCRGYRKRITDESMSIPQKGVFEQTSPVSPSHGNVFWMHYAPSIGEEDEEG